MPNGCFFLIKIPESRTCYRVFLLAYDASDDGAELYLRGVEHGYRLDVPARSEMCAVLLVGEEGVSMVREPAALVDGDVARHGHELEHTADGLGLEAAALGDKGLYLSRAATADTVEGSA